MLQGIQLYYFSKIIFSFLEERHKLLLIKYNKSLQMNLDISLNHYKCFSRRYIIYESNVKGKECNGSNDELIFEGEYKKGERNGKGKEYTDGKLIFEGEYLNGKRNGNGKEYYWHGKLRFEGEYLNDKKLKGKIYDKRGKLIYELDNNNGFKKFYDNDGELIFEGEYINGLRNGKGKEYNGRNGKLKYEGEYINGLRNGKGKEYDRFNGKLIF